MVFEIKSHKLIPVGYKKRKKGKGLYATVFNQEKKDKIKSHDWPNMFTYIDEREYSIIPNRYYKEQN